MEIEIISSKKDEIELTVNNQTIAEIVRVYLNDQGIEFAAWRKEHPTKPVVFRIQAKGTVKKAVSDAISAIKKDLNSITSAVKN